MVHVHQVRVGPSWMDLIVLFLKEDILLKEKSEAEKCEERPLGFGYSRTKNCISTHFLGRTCYAYILKYQSYSLRSYMKGFEGAMQEADLCPIKPSLRDIGGRACKKKHKNM